MRHVDTLSTIYRHIFHSKLPTKTLFVEKKWSKVGLILSRKFQITYKIIVCGEKTVKIGTILFRKSSQDPSWLAMCNVCIRNELPNGLPARFNTIQHKGDILLIRTCGEFYVSFVYRYFHEQSTCRIVLWILRQSIISTIDNSTISNIYKHQDLNWFITYWKKKIWKLNHIPILIILIQLVQQRYRKLQF